MSAKSFFLRLGFNFFPAIRGSGGRVTYIADDLKELHVKIPLNWRTKNYVGTTFGGSMFGAVDPFYMVLFINLLGKAYIVWDKSATIYFKKPGRSTLRAKFLISDEELNFIRSTLDVQRKLEKTYIIELVDEDGEVCAVVEKLLYFRKK
ncbi:MAG: DUF4442 domain-containing protein [Pseudomonadota bacterium]